jgi:PAS domain S-box-containing protein
MKRIEEAAVPEMLDGTPIATIAVDYSGHIIFANLRAESLFGYARGELAEQQIEILIPERFHTQHPKLREQFELHPNARPMGAGRDLFARKKDGTEFPVEIGLNPLQTEHGSFVLAAVVDLTERKRMENEILQTNHALVASNLELQQFAFVASHDLREPVRQMAALSDLLNQDYRDKLDADGRRLIDEITSSCKRLEILSRDLLVMARVESREIALNPLALAEVFKDAVELLGASIAEKKAVVTADTLPVVLGDRSQLTRLLLNLIGNALKYVKNGAPEVHVASRRDGGEWIVSVSDNGIGIDAKDFETIFQIFRRLHTASQYTGTGIGLAVCRRIVQRHGGKIWVESAPGKGSTFSFSLFDVLSGRAERRL